MNREATIEALRSLGSHDAQKTVHAVEDGSTVLLRTEAGSSVALLRRGEKYDALVLGAEGDCPVPSLRAVLETAVLPLSDRYAAHVGVAVPERDAVRKRIREASVALDVIAKGRHFSVAAPDLSVHPEVRKHIESGLSSVNQLPDEFLDNLALLNQFQANVVTWSREIDRLVQIARNGPDAVLSVEEETVFWSSLDSALSGAQQRLSSAAVKVTLDILARKRRATGFLVDATSSIESVRRKAAGVLALIQGLPIVALRTAEDLQSLRGAVAVLLGHVAAKLRVSSFSVERVLSLVDSMGSDVCKSVGRIILNDGELLQIPFERFVQLFESCCELFESWSQGFNQCRKVAREAARKKGEAMPQRRKSPLSNLHAHLSDVYELRADYQALRLVLRELSKNMTVYNRKVEDLDSAFEYLRSKHISPEYFDSPADESVWVRLSAEYRTRLISIEVSISTAYKEVVQSAKNVLDLSGSIHPFGNVLEKHFMAAAVAEAVPIVLDLGRRYMLLLQNREAHLRNGLSRLFCDNVPAACNVLAESRILSNRSTQVLCNLERTVGKSQLDVAPSIREFMADVEFFQKRANPKSYLRRWLDSIEFHAHERYLLRFNHPQKDRSWLDVSMEVDTAALFIAMKQIRGDQNLYATFENHHIEFSRKSKVLFAIYSNIREAVDSLNATLQRLTFLPGEVYDRIIGFLTEKRLQIRSIIEEGCELCWNDHVGRLSTFSVKLCQASALWVDGLNAVLQRDRYIQDALTEVTECRPTLRNGRVCESTTAQLSKSFSQLADLIARSEALAEKSADVSFRQHIRSHWLSKIQNALLTLYRKLSVCWAEALCCGSVVDECIVLDVKYVSSRGVELLCTPSIRDLETRLYDNLGDLYEEVIEIADSAFAEMKQDRFTKDSTLASTVLRYFLNSAECRDSACAESILPGISKDLQSEVKMWVPYIQFLDPALYENSGSAVKKIGYSVQILEHLLGRQHQIEQLQGSLKPASGRKLSFHLLDTTSLGSQIMSKCTQLLHRYCDACSVPASAGSQVLYKRITDGKKSITEPSGPDTMCFLSKIQYFRETVLPEYDAELLTLHSLEHKFQIVRQRVTPRNLSLVHPSDSWISTDELRPHLEEFRSLLEQRTRSLLVNREDICRQHERCASDHREAVAGVFSDLQKIRNSEQKISDFADSTTMLCDMKRKLKRLDEDGATLELVSKALGVRKTVDRHGPKQILEELERVISGIARLCSIDEKIESLSIQEIGLADLSNVQKVLSTSLADIDSISKSTGARREAKMLRAKLCSVIESNNCLLKLSSVKLSPPRERDVMRKLFGDRYQKSGLTTITLETFWSVDVHQHSQYFRNVLENAAGEASIAEYFASIERAWSGRKVPFREYEGATIVQGIPDLLDELDEHLQGLETMSASKHARLFEADRAGWEQRLAKCREDIEVLSDVQSRWAHLRTLFRENRNCATSGLRVELRDEFLAFSDVNARFISFGERLQTTSGIIEALEGPSAIRGMSDELVGIVRCLSSFLERQRGSFPRYFFLSDNDLLQVISASPGDVGEMTHLLRKLFPGISSVSYKKHDASATIDGVFSEEGELLAFEKPMVVSYGDSSTAWLLDLQRSITILLQTSLRTALEVAKKIFRNRDQAEIDSFFRCYCKFPAQIGVLAVRIAFTEAVEECFFLAERTLASVEVLGSLISESLLSLCNYDAFSVTEQKIQHRYNTMKSQLIKEMIYERDVLEILHRNEVFCTQSHFWQHELRFYLESSPENAPGTPQVHIRCGNGSFSYGWEYLGVGEGLVRTKLTSRCFMTLCEALRRGFGGSPYGPAGTGKTETVKALGRAMGRIVSVFNCDESFDSVSVGRILAGACRVGSWVCFDEFNRLSSGILSSTSGQLAILQASVRNDDEVIENFYGGDLPVTIKKGIGIFVTMNPGYSGRRELPANLKSLFRPCPMVKPDSQAITEVLLLSQGFRTQDLAKKVVVLFDHLRICLPARSHYDFGLRSLKSAILVSGSLLRILRRTDSGCNFPESEEDIVVRALGDVLKPKLHPSDVRLYENAIRVAFTEASCFSSVLPSGFQEMLTSVVKERGLIFHTELIEKLCQLYALLKHQSAVMLVGPTGCGKSVVRDVLYETLKANWIRESDSRCAIKSWHKQASLTVLDPKLLTSRQLYGELDSISREWSDGLFTKVLRQLAESSGESNNGSFPLHWIVFDGDIDPDWVETLNSVLDDNKILTLPTGEQIPLSENTRILFETTELRHANPSTVSRCGMVCFGERLCNAQILTSAVSDVLNETCAQVELPDQLQDLMSVTVNLAESITNNSSLVMHVPLQSLLDSCVTIFRHSLEKINSERHAVDDAMSQNPHGSKPVSRDCVLKTLLTSIVKSLTAGLCSSTRQNMSQAVLARMQEFEEVSQAMEGGINSKDLSEVDVLSDGTFVKYQSITKGSSVQSGSYQLASSDAVIPTSTTVRLRALLRDCLNLEGKIPSQIVPVLLCGPPGCGKSMIVTSALREIPNVALATQSFSSETSPDSVIATLRGHMRFAKHGNGSVFLEPKNTGCRVVFFCDEINLEMPDKYDTQKSVAFLRCIVERGGFWYGHPAVWATVRGLQIVAACNPEHDAGRHRLPGRFLKLGRLIRVEQPNSDDLNVIYSVFVGALLSSFGTRLLSKEKILTQAMVEYFNFNKSLFCTDDGSPRQPHYIYSPRDLSRWVRGMTRILLHHQAKHAEEITSERVRDGSWDEVVGAFCYEAKRIFCDRLVSSKERESAELCLVRIVRESLGTNLDCSTEALYTTWLSERNGFTTQDRPFRLIRDPQHFRTMIYQKLRVFAEEEGLGGSWMSGLDGTNTENGNSTMIDQFAVTDDVLTHLTRIERILCQPLGHCVLIGAPGTGKKTLARFAAWMLGMEVHQVHSNSAYSEEDFASDLRAILCSSGVNCREVMLIFDESNALDSAFLEMMNSVLACGEVPGLFSGDDRSRLLQDLRVSATSGISRITTEQGLYAEFVRRIRLNLHVVFTMSSGFYGRELLHTNRRHRSGSVGISERSPALYNRCTVNWIGDWTQSTLEAVAELKIEVSLGQEKDQIIRSAVRMHELADLHYKETGLLLDVTPRHYLEFIEQLNRIALEKGKAIQAGVDRHRQGLNRLRKAGVAVDELKAILREKSLSLQQKEFCAGETLEKMIVEQQHAEKSKVAAENLAHAAREASARVQEREEKVATQLAAVEPKVAAASEAVGSIRKEYLDELRAMPNPPSGARIALEVVLTILDGSSRRENLQYTWGSIRTRMRGSDFISSVANFDPRQLPMGIRNRVEKQTLANPDFDIDRISYASRAAGPLAEWALAVLDYAAVIEAVEPLREEVAGLQDEQGKLCQRQEVALSEVETLSDRINVCKSEYSSLVSEAERIRQDIHDSEKSVIKAEKMLDSLAREWDRWVLELNSFNAAAVTVWGNAICGAAFIAYAGALDHLKRDQLVKKWQEVLRLERIPFDEDLKICGFLCSEVEKGVWSTKGLETDDASLENYAILKRSARFPLIVDPTRNVLSLLQRVTMETSNENKTKAAVVDHASTRISKTSFTTTGKKSYMRTLESAMRFGTSVLVEDADKFDRAIAPLLGQESSYGNGPDLTEMRVSSGNESSPHQPSKHEKTACQRVVRLGDKDVFINANFRLYLAAVQISSVPKAAVTRSNVVSFDLSAAALQSNCETKAMQLVLPKLEKKRKSCLSAKVEYETRKHSLEEEVLTAITDVDDIGAELLDGPLLANLTNLKNEVETLDLQRIEEQKASVEIDKVRSMFDPLGKVAVDIFSVLQSLTTLDPVYMFNTSFFLAVFDSAMVPSASESPPHLLDTISHCQKLLLQRTFLAVATSLFSKDRLAFACALALIFARSSQNETHEENEVDIESVISAMQNICQTFTHNVNENYITDVLNLMPKSLLSAIDGRAVSLQIDCLTPKLAAVNVLRSSIHAPCHVLAAVDGLACCIPGGSKIIHGQNTGSEASLRKIVSEFSARQRQHTDIVTHRNAPLLLCAKGENTDPTTIITKLANTTDLRVMSVAMGAKQTGDDISKLISQAIQRSSENEKVLLLLKNLHLACKSATDRLQAEIVSRKGLLPCLLVAAVEVSPQFSGSSVLNGTPFFQVMAFESPSSFRTNLISSFEKISSIRKEGMSQWCCQILSEDQAHIILAWLHACLLERALHAPTGFSKQHEFPESDLVAAWDVLECKFRLSSTGNFESRIAGTAEMLCFSVYGSRVREETDLEILRAIIYAILEPKRIRSSITEQSVSFGEEGCWRVTIPLDRGARADYLDNMPLEASPKWVRMPEDTNEKRLCAEGRQLVEKIVRISSKLKQSPRTKWKLENKDEDHPTDKSATALRIEEMAGFRETVHLEGGNQTPLSLCLQMEISILSDTLLRILPHFFNGRTETSSQGTQKGQSELTKQSPQSSILAMTMPIPPKWKNVCSGLKHDVSVKQYVDKLYHAYLEYSRIGGGDIRAVNLSAVLRPGAILEALRSSEALNRQAPLHSLDMFVTGEQADDAQSWQLKGVQIVGASWSKEGGTFTNSQEILADPVLRWLPSKKHRVSQYMTLPLYGEKEQETLLASVKVPIAEGDSFEDWRLSGACLIVE